MEPKAVPSHPSLEQYKKQAKDLVKQHKTGTPDALQRIRQHHPRFRSLSDSELLTSHFALTDAQLIIAREHGFEIWPSFSAHLQTVILKHAATLQTNPSAAFIEAACVPLAADHRSGTLESAEEILARHPYLATNDIYCAAILGDDSTIRRLLSLDPVTATAKGGLHNWDALTYLCFSRYLRLDKARSQAFVRTAQALLDAGANPNTGWYEKDHQPHSVWESAIYGAAGIAQHPELTRLLLDRGADPNDDETPYHVPETHNNAVLKVLLESGRLNPESLSTLLLRKADWHDLEGIKLLLDHGTDPNRMTRWHYTALQQALRRDNHIDLIEAMLDHGADPLLENRSNGKSAIAMAARRGRGDVLHAVKRRGTPIELHGVEQLIAACATDDHIKIHSIVQNEPSLRHEILKEGGELLAEFAGNGNTEGVQNLLKLGVGVNVTYTGDGYYDIAKNSTALHVAAWRARHTTVQLLLDHGASVNQPDGRGRTPLALAIRACVDSYWSSRRTLESIRALLQAGASVTGIDLPSGYPEADELLQQFKLSPELQSP